MSPTPIVLASDDAYAQHLGVTMRSLLATARSPRDVHFYILDGGLSGAHRERLLSIASEGCARIDFVGQDLRIYDGFPVMRYGLAAYMRLCMGSLLPATVQKVIYLDCDVLVLDSIETLFETSLDGKTIAAVENLGHQPVQRLGVPEGEYFNSGVLVVDLTSWRETGAEPALLQYLQDNGDKVIFPDQDALNVVLNQRWKRLPLRWNQQPATYSTYGKLVESDIKREFRDAVERPGIVHFLGNNKPWEYMTFHPLQDFYEYHLSATPWRNAPLRGRTWRNRVRKWLMVEKGLKCWLRRRLGPQVPVQG